MNKKTILSAAAISMVVSVSSAQAGSLATAFMDVSNFQITKGNTGVVVNNTTDLQGLVFNSNASAGASLSGFAPITTGTVQSSNPAVGIDLFQSLGAVPGAYVENTPASHVFSSANGDPSANFAFGDQLEINAPIANVNGSPVGAHIYNQSTASIVNSGEAGATSNNGLVANWQFQAGFNDFLTFNFDLSVYLESYVSGGLVAPSTANSAASQIFQLVDINDPLGGNLLTGVGASLVFNTGVNSPSDNGVPDVFALAPATGTPFNGNFTFTSSVLETGKTYRLTANQLTSASTQAQAVPEPSVLALMGLGILGMTGLRKRKA